MIAPESNTEVFLVNHNSLSPLSSARLNLRRSTHADENDMAASMLAEFPLNQAQRDEIVEIAHAEARNVADSATAYWATFDAFDLGWLWDGVGNLPRSDRWQEQARSSLRDDLMTVLPNSPAT